MISGAIANWRRSLTMTHAVGILTDVQLRRRINNLAFNIFILKNLFICIVSFTILIIQKCSQSTTWLRCLFEVEKNSFWNIRKQTRNPFFCLFLHFVSFVWLSTWNRFAVFTCPQLYFCFAWFTEFWWLFSWAICRILNKLKYVN